MYTPYLVIWESTKACDFICKHCRAISIKERLQDELSTEEVFKLIEEISDWGVKLFIISGGDPLKRDDIFDILEYSSKKISTAISPSGSNIDYEIAKKIKDSGVSIASISVDGPEKIHDEFRGFTGAFKLAKKAIESFNSVGLPLQINTTISKYNIGFLEEVKETVLSFKPKNWDIFMLIPTGRATKDMMINSEEGEYVMRKVIEWRFKEGINVRMTCSPYLVRLINQEGYAKPKAPDHTGRKSIEGARGCMAGNGFIFVSYNGLVYPCGFLPIPAGSIRDKPLKEIYNSSAILSSLRDVNKLKGKCGLCEYRSVCGGCRARAFSITGEIFEEDVFCNYNPKLLR